MLGILVEKQERVFTTMKNRTFILLIISVISIPFIGSQCKRNTVTENIPTGPVNLTIDLNLPSNVHLNTVGNFSYFDGGVRGVLLIHDYDDNWYAFERTCSFQPLDPCARVWIDSANLQIKCGTYSGNQFTSCCQSSFIFSGFPIKGPAKGRLAQYKVQRNSNLLYIYN